MIEVLDHGYVELLAMVGDETTIAHAAGQSYGVHPRNQEALLRRMVTDGLENTPFETCFFRFEMRMPEMVFRHVVRHRIAVLVPETLNVKSRRYIRVEEDEFYVSPEDAEALQETYEWCYRRYLDALNRGVRKEVARLHLPGLAIYLTCEWTINVWSLMNWHLKRLSKKAQPETRAYAQATWVLFEEQLPNVAAAFREAHPELEYER
jgi:thymidylate synthase (FAD)